MGDLLQRRDADKLGWKILGWLLDLLVGILVMLSIWTGKQLFELEKRQTVYDANVKVYSEAIRDIQITQKEILSQIQEMKLWKTQVDSNNLKASDGKDIWLEIAKLKESISRISTEVPNWFMQRIDKIEARQEKMEERFRLIEGHTLKPNN